MGNSNRPDFSLQDRHDIEQVIAHTDTVYWKQLTALLIDLSALADLGGSSGPKLRMPERLSLVLYEYAKALFYIEASKFPKPHPQFKRWLEGLAKRTREHVIKRLIEVESSKRDHSLQFHGLSPTQARKVINEGIREMQQRFSPNEGSTISAATTTSEEYFSSMVAKQAKAYADAGVDIMSGSPLLMMAAEAGRRGRQAIQTNQSTEEKRKAFIEPLLREKGWSALDWANEAEVSYHTAADYLSGARNPYRSTRAKLANALGVNPNSLPD